MGSAHDGHRQRVRKQFLAEGFTENTPPHKLLELLLFYAIPRKDTNELAHRLMNRFGSFADILDAPKEELMKVEGISENSICLLKSIMPAARLYMESKKEDTIYIKSVNMAADFLASKFLGLTTETVFLLCLNNKGRILACPKISEGDDISVAVSARTIIEEVFKTGATAVMLAHNHPKGFAFPSPADLKRTSDISTALFHIGVTFLDHIIVADGDYISLAQSKEYDYVFKLHRGQ